MELLKKKASQVNEILGSCTSWVGVKFFFDEINLPHSVEALVGHRYCQALMKARHGKHVLLNAEGISCPAAAAAFGFKPLPEGLKSGKGLMGFGIAKDVSTGKTMFEGMTTLPQSKLKGLYLFPLETAVLQPDIVVVEDEAEKLMWIALAYLNSTGGHRIESSTAILQATCVDATLIPFIKQKFNMSMGCYGCRDATDIGPNETVLGFPFKEFKTIVQNLEFLSQKAIPNSRGKNALAMLKRKEAEKISKSDPFQK
ncbi:MAG: hypothetical protein PWR20_1139 [Bacteroidales bacterium]|jgi:uncharacterized protein (DUF169 family)|nr:hypothetical protein [Bacteroidales bacterium]MDN5330168.1 hypothetical protein [Bacteroidales bacterium]